MSQAPRKARRQQARFDPNRGSAAPEMIDLVDAGWILKALGGVLLFALLCAYATMCVVFHYNQWQLVLHASRTVAVTPAAVDLPFTEVHFGMDDSGKAQLDGWWIPGGDSKARTVLLLHGADGSIADALPTAETLHELKLNVLVFDYRGYGRSGGAHPTEATMEEDTRMALRYLEDTRQVKAGEVVVYGSGLGAALALQVCDGVRIECAAIVLDGADGDLLARVAGDTRAKIMPTSLLFRERFPLAEPLLESKVPKLLISYTEGEAPAELRAAHDPKMLVELSRGDRTAYVEALRRFLDEYAARS
jgi:pimeloyl-ACP methyl ester carboxylesterase